MRLSLALLVAAAATVACGGRATINQEKALDAGSQACLTSQGCAAGLRCDSGLCVSDTMCPPAQPPALIFEPVADSPWAIDRPHIVELSGHELLTSSFDDLSASALRFHDLRTGEESILPHPTGVAYCAFDPSACISTDYTAFSLFEGVSLNEHTSLWSATSERSFTVAGSPIGSSADLAARRLPIWNGRASSISILDLDTARVAVDFSLDGSLAAVIPDARGVSTSVVTTNSGASPYVLKSALLREGATASVVYRGDGIRLYAVLLTNGEPRYAVRENGRADAATSRVERVVNAVPTALGTFADPPASALDYAYMTNLALEPGPAMYALDCATGGQCRSFLIHLDPVSVELIAEAQWPHGLQPSVSGVRRLACGARDLVLVNADSVSQQHRVWSLRLPGRPGLP